MTLAPTWRSGWDSNPRDVAAYLISSFMESNSVKSTKGTLGSLDFRNHFDFAKPDGFIGA